MNKKFYSLLALSAALVGCSDEAIFENAPVADALSTGGRVQLGKVELGIGGPATRMAIADVNGTALEYAEGDQLGACIFDEPDFTATLSGTKTFSGTPKTFTWTYDEYMANVEKTNTGSKAKPGDVNWTPGSAPINAYTIKDYISTNYPYTRESGKWSSQANLVEGNYVFYMPFNKAHVSRRPLTVSVPTVQDASDAVTKKSTYKGAATTASKTAVQKFYEQKESPVLLGYKFLGAPADRSTVIKPEVQLSHLFAYPMFTIVNDFDGFIYSSTNVATATAKQKTTMIIDRVELVYDGVNTPIFASAPVNNLIIPATLPSWDSKRFTTLAPTVDVLGAPTAMPTIAPASVPATKKPYLAAAETAVENTVSQYVTLNVNKELAIGESYHFHGILPADDYGHDLKARIYATIAGKKYVLLVNTNTSYNASHQDVTNPLTTNKVVKTVETTGEALYAFRDAVHGDKNVVLIRGERFPQAEYTENGQGLKAFAGQMLTVNLANLSAFELNDGITPPTTDNGIKDNDDFFNYINSYVQRGIVMREASVGTLSRDNWAIAGNPGRFALASTNNVVIDQALVNKLYLQIIEDPSMETSPAVVFTTAGVKVGNDVNILSYTGNDYTFKVSDTQSLIITLPASSGTVSALKDGINNIAATTGELKMATGAANAVVYLNSGANVDVKNAVDNALIIVEAGATLNVKGACNARVVATGGTINVLAGGSLTNAKNNLAAATVTNNGLGAINGLGATQSVSATLSAWPAAVINANTHITTFNITCTATQIVEQAQINVFANMAKPVALVLTGATQLTSASNVKTTNIASISSTATTWTNSTVAAVQVTLAKIGTTTNTTLTGITAAGTVSIVNE